MGDGQHVWAAAEWVLMIRNCFLYEEDDCLVIGAGVPARWLETKEAIHFGPAPTSFGILQISIEPHHDDQYIVHWDPVWHRRAPRMEVRMPECKHVVLEPAQCGQHGHITIERAA